MKLKKYLSAIIGSLLLTLGVVTFTGSMGIKVVNAETTESVNFSKQGYEDKKDMTVYGYEGTNFSVSFDKGSNSNQP
ncbi:MAG: hypothetical protein MR270_02330, partial [Erysipelotrichaceae bacterium]|nr:hypothetical protein [Erysipelotrichaceae bacterium]